jgi:Single Cache domain 2
LHVPQELESLRDDCEEATCIAVDGFGGTHDRNRDPQGFEEDMMRKTLAGILLVVTLPVIAAAQIPGEVSCDKGVDIAKVQALVKRTVEALKKDQDKVIQEINRGDKQWKDGDYYMVVVQGTKILAHGYMPWLAGQDVGGTTYQNTYAWMRSAERVATEKGEGCIQYRFHNPAKGGQIEDKVSYGMKVNGNLWAGSGTYLVRK